MFVEDVIVYIDPILTGLILDNLISNAFRHGRSPHPDVELHVDTSGPVSPPGKTTQLSFAVTNAANAARPPITPEYVQEVLAGTASRGRAVSAMSDQIGLQHSFMAAKAHGMTLSLRQEGEQV